jgi:cysteine desulfurase/selenocysteine lyase
MGNSKQDGPQGALMNDLESIRADFPYLSRTINSKPIIYFDNAATTQKPRQVIEALTDFYTNYCANIHRGVHTLSQEASDLYEEARARVARFINADEREIIFVRNTTEAITLVAETLKRPGSVVTSVAEHHSNFLPWRQNREVKVVDIDALGLIDLYDLRAKLDESVALVAVNHASNMLGLINPIEEVITEAKRVGALCLIDAAQSIPHMEIDVQELDCDFLVFSGHKMLGPSGIGVLYVREDLYEHMKPEHVGGSSIKEVHVDSFVHDDPPQCYETGTPNIEGAIALGAAIDYLDNIGMETISAHDRKLVKITLEKMRAISNVEIYGDTDPKRRLSVISFNVKGVGCHSVAKVLNLRENVMIRSGFHCAQPLHDRLGIPPSARISLYIYNTEQEILKMINQLERLAQFI